MAEANFHINGQGEGKSFYFSLSGSSLAVVGGIVDSQVNYFSHLCTLLMAPSTAPRHTNELDVHSWTAVVLSSYLSSELARLVLLRASYVERCRTLPSREDSLWQMEVVPLVWDFFFLFAADDLVFVMWTENYKQDSDDWK